MNECINVYEGFEYQTRLSIIPLMTWQNIATKQYSNHKMITFQCLQIDQVGNSRNDITQNDLKNFSATYNLKIGTWDSRDLKLRQICCLCSIPGPQYRFTDILSFSFGSSC